MQKNIFVFVLSFLCLQLTALSQTIIPGGDVSGTWTLANSPYQITGDITIPDDSTLTIEPGVLIVFQGHYWLDVQGRLLAEGTETDTIVFLVNDTTGFHNPDTSLGGWNGIHFIDTPQDNDSSKIKYCKLQYGKAVGTGLPDNNGGAIYIANFNKLEIAHCLIISNSAGGSNSPAGGGLALYSSSIKLEENEISNNRAWDGGAVIIYECDPVFINNQIISNYAEAGGGGVWIGGLANPVFNGDIFANNVSGSNGGGIVCWQTTDTKLNSVTFINNFSNWGGGIGVIDCELQMINCILNSNSVTGLGGGLAADFSTVYLNKTIFTRDTSGALSGAIHTWYSDLQIVQCKFIDNQSDFGGAIHSDFSTLQIDSCTFNRNKAIDGGGIHSSNTNLHIDSCLFFQNEVSNSSGGIQYHIDTTEFTNPYQIEILNSRFIQNSAFYRGAIEIQQFNSESSLVNIEINKCEFIENAIDRGGNLLIAGYIDDFLIASSIFRGNIATLRTSVCNFNNHVKGKVVNCLFTSNQTSGGSSASAIGSGSNVTLINCTLSKNLGSAALTLRNDGHSSILNNIFWDNHPSNVILNAVNDTTPCTLEINYNDMQFGMDSIIVNDTVSVVNWGIGNINIDPFFVDTSNNDFRLQNSSPCIGAGIDSIQISGVWYVSPITDIEGNPRPNPSGSMPDIGASESPLGSPAGIEENFEEQIPNQYFLSQNYPNPFNPITHIQFGLPKISDVKIEIYNIIGQRVSTLINARKPAGYYVVDFYNSQLASGIYLYRIQAGNYIDVKKMVLMK